MLFGPAFGGGRGDPHRPHDEPRHPRRHAHPRGRVDRGQRPLDPRLHRVRDRRQRAAARQGRGALRGRDPRRASGPASSVGATAVRARSARPAFFLNAAFYGVSFLIYRFGVADHDADERASRAGRRTTRASTGAATGSCCGARTSGCSRRPGSRSTRRSACGSASRCSSSRKDDPRFPDQFLMGGFSPVQISLAAVVIGLVFGAGLFYWGNRFKNMRRTTIILYGILGGAVLVARRPGDQPRRGRCRSWCRSAGHRGGASGCSCSPARRPAALGLLADISEGFPADRGAIMGLYSVFLAIGQIIGSLVGGVAADWRGHRRHLRRHVAMLLDRAPAARPAPAPRALRRRARPRRPSLGDAPTGMTERPALGAGPARPRRPGRGRRAASPRDGGRPRRPARRRLGGRRGDRDERRRSAWSCPAAAASAATRSG